MSDTITRYAGDAETVILIDAQPDPRDQGYFLINNQEIGPVRCKLSLRDHAYNIILPPDSYVIIEADETEMFRASKTDDRVVFVLPSNNIADFYWEQYITNTKGQLPYTAVILRQREMSKIISAALYPRDIDKLPPPRFTMPDGNFTTIESRNKITLDDSETPKLEFAPNPHDLEHILNAVYKKTAKPLIDPNAPKESWF